MTINRESHTPLYMQFYQLLKQSLGAYAPGDNLPPERVLCEQHGVDRTTARKALAMLAAEGLVERRQGSGTRVLARRDAGCEENCVLFALYQGAQAGDRLSEPFYARSLDAFERRLHQMKKRLVYSMLREGDNLAALCGRFHAGSVILAGSMDGAMASQCRALTIPVATYNNRVNGLPSVLPDNALGAEIAANALISRGHRRVGFIHVPGYGNADARLAAFRNEMARQAPDGALYIAEGDWNEESGYASLKALLNAHPDITGVFAGNDSMAFGVLRACAEMGISVPRELSVIGFDDVPQAAAAHPPLTTLRVDIDALVEGMCMLLFFPRGDMPRPPVSVMALPALMNRETLAAAGSAAPNRRA